MYELYVNIYLFSIISLTLITSVKVSKLNFREIQNGTHGTIFAFFLCLIFAIWFGNRPPTYEFADTGNYAKTFEMMSNNNLLPVSTFDWVWFQFTYNCSQIMSVSSYFTLIALGYFFCTFYSCYILTKKNVLISLLFLLGAFSFFSYGVNGIRNGLACSIVLLIIALLLRPKHNILIVLALSFIAINIHKSVILPIGCLFIAKYLIKNFKTAYIFWLFSIVISLIAGNSISSVFAGLGFDDRLSYLTSRNNIYTNVGFRWDFLLYSMMPILLGYYIIIRRGLKDKTYETLINTYTLANAFWIIVIRANYSNRFAYLSWFIYPLVLVYPLLKLDIWGNQQGVKLSRIMLAQVAFTLIMSKLI